ncbi:MAG: hypothetical protein VB092_01120 [Oscillospiraceae bacterium]|nr:hypothetical protein [Oscillospiraceae bacterium]
MKNKYMLFAGGAALLAFVQRLVDISLHVAPSSGFYDGGSAAVRWSILLLCAVVCIYLQLRCAAPGFSERRKLPAAGLLFALCCLFSVSLSAMQAIAEVLLAPSLAVGIVSALCALAGIFSAWWYYTAAVSCFSKKKEGGDLLPAAVVFWYCLRALDIFVREPVNARDSVTISALFSCVALAAAYLSLARRKPGFPAAAALSLVACVGFALPCAVWFLREGDTFRAAQLLGDAFGAAALFFVAAAYAQPVRKENV